MTILENSNVALALRGVSKHYAGKCAITDLTMDLEPGVFYGLLGANGAGKSTLLKLITDAETADSGKIYLANGIELGYVSSELGLPEFLRLQDIARLFAASHRRWLPNRYLQVLSFFKLEPELRFGGLSAGAKAGVKLGLMLAQKPTLWLLDEATLGLDIVAQNQCLELLMQYFIDDAPTVVFCSHNLSEIEKICEQIIVLEQGKLAWKGNKDDLVNNEASFPESIQQLYSKT